jgi:hypothetical protein
LHKEHRKYYKFAKDILMTGPKVDKEGHHFADLGLYTDQTSVVLDDGITDGESQKNDVFG